MPTKDNLFNSLTKYVNDIKPFHTKIKQVSTEIYLEDQFNAAITDSIDWKIIHQNIWTRDDIGGYRLNRLCEGNDSDQIFRIPAAVWPRFSINDNVGQNPNGDNTANGRIIGEPYTPPQKPGGGISAMPLSRFTGADHIPGFPNRFNVPYHQGSRVYLDGTLQSYGIDYIVDESRSFIEFIIEDPEADPPKLLSTSIIDVQLMKVDRLFIAYNLPFDIGDNFSFEIDEESETGHTEVEFTNTIPSNNPKAALTITGLSNLVDGETWTITATSMWEFKVTRSSDPEAEWVAKFKQPFDNGFISFIIDRTWLDYYMTADTDTYDVSTNDKTDFLTSLNLITQHGVIIDPVPQIHKPIEFSNGEISLGKVQLLDSDSMALTINEIYVSRLYVVMYNRAPDRAGLDFWLQGLNSGSSLEEVAQDMFDTTPGQEYYPPGTTDEQIITKFYANSLGRIPPEPEGLASWTAGLTLLKTNGDPNPVGKIVTSFIESALTYLHNTDTENLFFNNRLQVANFWLVKNGSIKNSAKALEAVTSDPMSVGRAKTLILNNFVESSVTEEYQGSPAYYAFVLSRTPKKGTYIELRVEQNGQLNPQVHTSITEDLYIKIKYTIPPYIELSTDELSIVRLYVVMFNKVLDRATLDVLSNDMETGKTLKEIAQELFVSDIGIEYYPPGTLTEQVFTQLYLNAINRQFPSPGDIAYWVNQVNDLTTAGDLNPMGTTIMEFIDLIIYETLNSLTSTEKNLFDNKVEVAKFWAEKIGGIKDSDKALVTVTSNSDSIAYTEALIYNNFIDIGDAYYEYVLEQIQTRIVHYATLPRDNIYQATKLVNEVVIYHGKNSIPTSVLVETFDEEVPVTIVPLDGYFEGLKLNSDVVGLDSSRAIISLARPMPVKVTFTF